MRLKNDTGALDPFRLIAAFLVIANHTSPFFSYGENADFILTRIIARTAVPFFLMVSGYFLYKYIKNGDNAYILTFCKKIALLYAFSIILFLPLNLYAGHYNGENWWSTFIKDLFIDGTFYHLWYFPGLILGILIVQLCVRKLGLHLTLLISIFLYLFGLFGDSYYGIATQITFIDTFYDGIFSITDYTRNGLFMVPIFLTMGMLIYQGRKSSSFKNNLLWFIVSFVLLVVEGLWLHAHSWQRHDSMYIMLVPTMYYLFLILLQLNGKSSKQLRNIATIMYIIHPWMIVVVRFTADLFKLEHLFIENSFVHYTTVSVLSFLMAAFLSWGIKWRKQTPSPTGRAWIEIDLQALRENIESLRKLLPGTTKLMAVVKANAYGHGAVKVAKELNENGINSFAVATLAEGIQLRKNRVKGEILVLGYTNPEDIHFLKRYRLTQTIIGLSYARELNKYGIGLDVQVKLDTGMHRLGVDASQLTELKRIYRCQHLKIRGIYSHLSVSDSLEPEDISSTNEQIAKYNQTIEWLQSQQLRIGRRHIQASYGLLNYPDLQYDYVRAGIALYGILSNNDEVVSKVELKPVLAIKARVAMVKHVPPGEFVSYGKAYAAKEMMITAVVTIGYADGLPRNLNHGHVLIHGQKAPIIGRICMDQLIVDVSDLANVQTNDVVTIIGKDGSERITSEEVAEKSGTITNELLSRLGSRLNYIYKNPFFQ